MIKEGERYSLWVDPQVLVAELARSLNSSPRAGAASLNLFLM